MIPFADKIKSTSLFVLPIKFGTSTNTPVNPSPSVKLITVPLGIIVPAAISVLPIRCDNTASFSFDGVIGAFAITKDIVVIMIGLGIGAMFVRSMTIYLVEKETLSEYRYLEHGAHYAIGVLAIIMLLSLQFHIPEVITGFIGILLIGLSLWSSIKHNRLEAQHL
jgi:hypothetical protein